jgi:hypothetical protein
MKRRAKFWKIWKTWETIAIGAIIVIGMAGCNTLQSIAVVKTPVQTVFGQGQEIDPSGLTVTATYKKSTETVAYPGALQITGYDKNRAGEQTITVTMNATSGLSHSSASNTFTVTVVPVESIAISQPPAATSFKQGDNADWNGLSVGVSFEKDAVPGITVKPGADRLSVSGYDKDKAGTQAITVDYYGKRAAFNVIVVGLNSIAVTTQPRKIEYYTGEEIDLTGLAVQGTWSDGSTARLDITNSNLSGYDITRGEKQNVTVSYSGKTTTFPVTYVAFDALSVSRPPTKTKYELGEPLDTTGMQVQATWPGHSLSLVNISRLKITGYNPLGTGEQRVTVTGGGQSDVFTVTVTNPFEGNWCGLWNAGNELEIPVTLRIAKGAWTLETSDREGKSVILRGVCTPDSGTHARLTSNDLRDSKGAGEVTLNSPNEMSLRNGLISGVTLDRR